MKKRISYLLGIMILFSGCTYFQVRKAYKTAEKGEYITSLYALSDILKSNPNDRRTLDAFELIYPQGEKEYYDQLDKTRDWDIEGYTKALLNLLRVQEMFYSLPEESRNSIAVIEPPAAERTSIKRESADSFYKIGNGFRADVYEDKLRKYGFYSEAKKYDVDERKDIAAKYTESMAAAEGKFRLSVNTLAGNKDFSDKFQTVVRNNIDAYPLFSVNNNKANISLDIKLSDFVYSPPTVQVYSGIDSYFETRIRRVMKKVVVKENVNGKVVERVKYIPVDEEYEVEIFYRFEKFVKTTYAEYNLNYSLKEIKGNREMAADSVRIRFTDEAVWVQYHPITPIRGGYHHFPLSESEKYVMGEDEVVRNAMYRGTETINGVLNKLDSNRIIGW